MWKLHMQNLHLQIEGLVQDYPNLILQESVKTDFYSKFWSQYKYFAFLILS